MSQQSITLSTHLKNLRRTGLIGLAFIAALLCTSAATAQALPRGLTAPAKPTAMPAFDLPTTAGPSLRSESLHGHVVVVRFWASW